MGTAKLTEKQRASIAKASGKRGGEARAKKLTAKRRREIASLGGKSTWERIRKGELSHRTAE